MLADCWLRSNSVILIFVARWTLARLGKDQKCLSACRWWSWIQNSSVAWLIFFQLQCHCWLTWSIAISQPISPFVKYVVFDEVIYYVTFTHNVSRINPRFFISYGVPGWLWWWPRNFTPSAALCRWAHEHHNPRKWWTSLDPTRPWWWSSWPVAGTSGASKVLDGNYDRLLWMGAKSPCNSWSHWVSTILLVVQDFATSHQHDKLYVC